MLQCCTHAAWQRLVQGNCSSKPMIRVALLRRCDCHRGGATIMVADRLINPAETPSETITSRFPGGWESAPVVEYKKPQNRPSAMPRMSTDEFIAAVTAVRAESAAAAASPPQRVNAVFNDAQIASMKHRLELTGSRSHTGRRWKRRCVKLYGIAARRSSKAGAKQPRAIHERPRRLSWRRSASNSAQRSRRWPISSGYGSTARLLHVPRRRVLCVPKT